MDKNSTDTTKAVKIAENTWWVGHYLEDDIFQCHTYLIKNGKESILIDPGSKLTFSYTLEKIEQICPFSDIRYFICHHQDPDITGALMLIDEMVTRDDAVILSHWRAIKLLKHYGLSLPMECVEKRGWKLKAGERELEFIFTPYLHFPGAFCSYDPFTKVLFSSDLFGGFTEDWSLFARDETYFESVRPFHEHYMPSRDILFFALSKFEQYPISMIAPQHGSIIPENLTGFMINRLKNTDCGLYLMTQTSTDIDKLSRLNRLLRDFMATLVLNRDFSTVAAILVKQIQEVLPLKELSFLCTDRKGNLLMMKQQTFFRSKELKGVNENSPLLNLDSNKWLKQNKKWYLYKQDKNTIILPLYSSETKKTISLAFLELADRVQLDEETAEILKNLSVPLSIAMEREIIQRTLDMERQNFYDQAIHDPLTGLYTRVYMKEAGKRLFAIDDRSEKTSIIAVMFDIDHFKSINDTYGHSTGDIVLKKVADVIMETTRSGDIQVRFGGEEFALFFISDDPETVFDIAERIRKNIAGLDFSAEMKDRNITISGGITVRKPKESLSSVLDRADEALYKAKNSGRNRIIKI